MPHKNRRGQRVVTNKMTKKKRKPSNKKTPSKKKAY